MKYRKPRKPVPQTVQPQRFFDPNRLSPQRVVLYYFVMGTLIAVMLFGGSILLWNRVAAWRAADVSGAPTQYGIATVETKRVLRNRIAVNHMRAQIGFRINGHLAMVDTNSLAEYDSVHIGERVDVQYRVGKSGDIYIDDWQAPRR